MPSTTNPFGNTPSLVSFNSTGASSSSQKDPFSFGSLRNSSNNASFNMGNNDFGSTTTASGAGQWDQQMSSNQIQAQNTGSSNGFGQPQTTQSQRSNNYNDNIFF